jgi:ABC-type branched-subunit amino acid transport system permease subunit
MAAAMASGWGYYTSTLLVYLGVGIIACLGLNVQLGLAGVMDFAFIIFQAVGAYAYAIFTLGPPTPSLGQAAGGESYVWGTSLPFPLPFVLATLAGALLAFLCAVIVLPRLRGDYEAMAFLVISLIVTGIATNQVGLVNGANGLYSIPQPLASVLNLPPAQYAWFYVGLTAAICLLAWVITRRITTSPMGRLLRAVRENEQAARALGKDATRARLFAFLVGGGLGGLSGAVLVAFLTAWAPASWTYAETFVYITAIVVGGFGRDIGILVGVLLVPIVLDQLVKFMPAYGQATWAPAAQSMAYGLLALLFLWFRPQGLLPERRVRYPGGGETPQPAAATAAAGRFRQLLGPAGRLR